MHTKGSKSEPYLSQEAIDEFNKLFAQVPAAALREALIKIYLQYATSDDLDLPQDIEKIDKPVQGLINVLGKIAGVQ